MRPDLLHVPALRSTRWSHALPHATPTALRPWLSHPGSLTARLMAHAEHFRVQRLAQGDACCLFDECAPLLLHRPRRVPAREVLLRCDGVPVVYAHTVLPPCANAHQWPRFHGLGERSLGSTLFNDPRVVRGPLEYARLSPGHALRQRLGYWLAEMRAGDTAPLYARRSLFFRAGSRLLVTEVFLPAVLELQRPPARERRQTFI